MENSTSDTRWITLPDGTRLAATLWMPEGNGPFPTVLEFLPYRRRDGTAPRDDSTYPAFAAGGVAGIRVDSRGMGDSDGFFDDEYSPTELQDICDVIAWIAGQPWSNGNVGIMGISWGGFNGLQVAMLRPPALKAVISIASTTDRYHDDIHYKGGCLLSANVYWAGTMLSYGSRPPDPEVVGNRWGEIWRERLEDLPLLLEKWLTHQHRDAYWAHGSVCEDWSAIECPVWVIAGWGDGYRNTPAALLRGATAPVKAMTGPWVHKYPHFAWPRPRADFTTMAIDWWQHWLGGEARGVESWPDHAAFRIEGASPDRMRAQDPGTWVAAPVNAERVETLALGDRGALPGTLAEPVTIATPQHCGTCAGQYFTVAPDADMPTDQRGDDALSACWETEAGDQPRDIVGRPSIRATVSIDRPVGNLIARLVDVHPDGTATLISRGVLNLCHRNSHATPEPVEPGERMAVTVMLDETAYRLPAGHRLRLAVSTAYWPLILPPPQAVTATLYAGVLELPDAGDLSTIEIAEPSDPSPLPDYEVLEAGDRRTTVHHDLTTGRVRHTVIDDSGLTRHPRNAIEARDTRDETWTIDPADPEGMTGELVFIAIRQRGSWATRTESRISFQANAESYDVTASLDAFEGETLFHRRDWSFSVSRKLV